VDTSGLTVRILLAPKTEVSRQLPDAGQDARAAVDVEPDWDSAANLGSGMVDAANPDLPRLLPVVDDAADRHERGLPRVALARRAGHADGADLRTDRARLDDGDGHGESVAADNHFLQMVLEGDPVTFQRQGIRANCGLTTVRLSQLLGHGAVGADGQCFIAYNGAGPFLLEGSRFEGAGENVMFGGGRCMSEAMVPSDIVVRGNHFTKDELAHAGVEAGREEPLRDQERAALARRGEPLREATGRRARRAGRFC
jgi:hypothetical protein